MTEATATSNVGLKLAAALVAFAAGIGAVVTVVVLAHQTPGAGSTSSGPQAASAPTPREVTFPSPPANALAVAQEDRDLAVGLAVARRGPKLVLQASVLGQESPADGLEVAFRVPGRAPVPTETCGAGCYRAVVAAEAPRSVAVTIRGSNRKASSLSFPLPASVTGSPAGPIVHRAGRVWRSLETLVVHDRLASGPGNAITTLWRFVAPDRTAYTIRNGPQAIVIGSRRWDRLPGQPWQFSEQDSLPQPVPLWESVSNARILGTATLRGRPVWRIAFFDPQIKAWFTIWVDRQTARTLELRMTAQAHFMHQVYGPFDEPLRIVPPAKAKRPA